MFSRGEIEFIADLCKKHNVLYISDEVYEWLVYDGSEHIRAGIVIHYKVSQAVEIVGVNNKWNWACTISEN